jgi:hypothetical protein
VCDFTRHGPNSARILPTEPDLIPPAEPAMNIIRLRTRNVVWNLRRRRRTAGTAPGAAGHPIHGRQRPCLARGPRGRPSAVAARCRPPRLDRARRTPADPAAQRPNIMSRPATIAAADSHPRTRRTPGRDGCRVSHRRGSSTSGPHPGVRDDARALLTRAADEVEASRGNLSRIRAKNSSDMAP